MDDTEILHDRIQERHRSLVLNDRATMETLLHDQYYYINAVGQTYNKEQFLNNFFDQPTAIDTDLPHNVSIEIDGTMATVSYKLEGVFTVAGRLHQGTFEISHTLAKINGEWIFLAGHFDTAKPRPTNP